MRLAVANALICSAAWGQGAGPHFDVASIRAADAQQGRPVFSGGPGTAAPSRLEYIAVTFLTLIERAYDVRDDQVSGPAWMRADRYDLRATLPEGTTQQQLRVMLQNLLAERFQLGFHRVKKEFELYELAQAKSGSKLKPGATLGKPNRARMAVAERQTARVFPSHRPIKPQDPETTA